MEANLSQDLNKSFNMNCETCVTQGTSTSDLDFEEGLASDNNIEEKETMNQSCQTMEFNQCCQTMEFSLFKKYTATEKTTDFTVQTASIETMTQSVMPQNDEDLTKSNASAKEFQAFLRDDNAREHYFKKEIEEIGRKIQRVHRMKEDLQNLLEKKALQMVKCDVPNKIVRGLTPPLAAKLNENSSTSERRDLLRKAVSSHRLDSRLKASLLRRKLIPNQEKQGPSESDGSFDMTPLDEALPPLLHSCRKIPRIGKPLKLQDAIRSNIERNRLIRIYRAGLFTSDATRTGGDSLPNN